MEYVGTDNNLAQFLRTSPELEQFVRTVAQQGAEYWTSHSVVDTGYNSQHVEARTQHSENGVIEGVIHATGYYAKWREIGSSRSGASAPEWVLRTIKHQVEG